MDLDTVKVGKTPDDRPISQQDSLSYNTILNNLANACLTNRGSSNYGFYVDAFRTALYLDLDGLPFKQMIDAKDPKIDKLVAEYKVKRIYSFGDGIYYAPECVADLTCMHKDILRNELLYYYNDEWLKFLLQLLGKHDALIRSRPYVSEGHEDEGENVS